MTDFDLAEALYAHDDEIEDEMRVQSKYIDMLRAENTRLKTENFAQRKVSNLPAGSASDLAPPHTPDRADAEAV